VLSRGRLAATFERSQFNKEAIIGAAASIGGSVVTKEAA
jgi:hypothetical protein